MRPKASNVIDLAKRRQTRKKSKKRDESPVSDEINHTENQILSQDQAPIVDMTVRRIEQIQKERRTVKRTILTEFIGAFAVLPQMGLMKVSLYDISENGMSFDVEMDLGKFAKGEEIAMRVYLNQYTYFPFVIKVRNQRQEGPEGVFRHGADFVKGSVNDVALGHFVKFIETVSASLERDGGDVMVSNLKE